MSNIKNMLAVYQTELSNIIKSMAKPLKDHFQIDEFVYSFISKTGAYFSISNDPEPSEFYFLNHLFAKSLHIRHPDNYSNEFVLSRFAPNVFNKSSLEMEKRFGLSAENCLTIFKKEKGDAHSFLFNVKSNDSSICSVYLNNISLLNTFCEMFLKKWNRYQTRLENYYVNIAEEIGPQFFEISRMRNCNDSSEKKMAFLKSIDALPFDFVLSQPLSTQEMKCMEHLYVGKTIVDAAQEMNLSPRTVESYLEQVKNKFSCQNKNEAVEIYHYLRECL